MTDETGSGSKVTERGDVVVDPLPPSMAGTDLPDEKDESPSTDPNPSDRTAATLPDEEEDEGSSADDDDGDPD